MQRLKKATNNIVKLADNQQGKEIESKCNDCEICEATLQLIRFLRRHKHQEHIETQPPGGTKRKATTTTTNLNNFRQDDPNVSPPPKIRALQNNQHSMEKTSPKIKTLEQVNKTKQFGNNFDEKLKKIKQLEDTVKRMMKQKREDDEGKKYLKAELAKANNLVAKISNEQEATQKESTNKTQGEKEEYPTDSEEERVLRNKHRGRGFLKAKRSKEKP